MCKIKTIEFRREEFQLPSNLNTEILGQAIPYLGQTLITEKEALGYDIAERLMRAIEKKGYNPESISYTEFTQLINEDANLRALCFENLLLEKEGI